jgi:tetratricopeptide (TPR) repeat protein
VIAIKKEQTLALLTLLVGAWAASSYLTPAEFRASFTATRLEYAAKPPLATPLVGGDAAPMQRRDFCTEPSETRPLPPRALAFPPRAPLSVAAIPLEPGPDFGHLYALRVDGALQSATPIVQGGAEAAPVVEAPAQEDGPIATRKELEERAARSYDRVWYNGLASPRFGTIEAEGHDLFALEERGDFTGVKLRLRIFDVTKQRLADTMAFGDEGYRIDRIALADNLRNEIRRRERKVASDTGHQPERRALVLWLLEQARSATECYDKALEHAQLYRQLGAGDPEGLRLLQRVLRARGDLAGELAMLEGLPTTGSEGAFRFEGLGALKLRLGLWHDAEADLQQAIRLMPRDARPHAALADFLRLRGRSREAAAAAARAEQALGSVQDAGEKVRVGRILVECALATGDVERARTLLGSAAMKGTPQSYLEGCIAYAAGELANALAAFRAADGTADAGPASFGQACCLAREGKLQEAHDLLLVVYDREPLLRARSAGALAWLFSRTGQFESATVWLDRALEADPQDPFAFYVRGRTLRLAGQTGAAIEALAAALRLRDDFTHAIAEMAAAQAALALEGSGSQQAEAAVAAKQYGDRAVALAPSPSLELYELQGLYRFDALDARKAAEAFARARDFSTDERSKWFGKGALAVVDYSRGLVDDAASALQRMTQDLGRDEPIAKWAQATLAAIDDHAQKETLGDAFDRSEPGTIWLADADGPLGPQVVGDRLVLRNSFSRSGKGEVTVARVGAVRRGKNFLASAVTMQFGNDQPLVESFAGLGIELLRSSGGGTDFRARAGIKDGKPFVRIEDGRDAGVDTVVHQALTVDGFDVRASHRIELRVVPRGEEQQRQFALLVAWGGRVVFRHDLKMLTANTPGELANVLFVAGRKGDAVDVAFDDYVLERRKDQR